MSGRRVVRAVVAGLAIVSLAAACSPAPDDRAPVIEMLAQDQFAPAGAMIEPGDHVLWSNQDDHVHQLDLGDGDSITVEPGDVVQTTFPRAGVWLVHDSAATEMIAVIEVLPR